MSNSTKTTGGFFAVPGFNRILKAWCESTQAYVFHPDAGTLAQEDEARRFGQQITARKGSFIIFSSELPHCSYPNESDQFRYAQYIRMIPRKTLKGTSDSCLARGGDSGSRC